MSSRKFYDVAIIGMGTMGSFAAVELARRGFSVAGIDQFSPPHARGSHSGGTRVYRIAYPEGTGYVQLAQRAGRLWDQAAEQLNTQLLHRTGMLYMGPPLEPFLRDIQQSAASNRLPVEYLSAEEVSRRYPAFALPSDYAGLLDPQAGWIDVDASITASHTCARALGVACLFDQPVQGWQASANEVQVHLQKETITAAKLIITRRCVDQQPALQSRFAFDDQAQSDRLVRSARAGTICRRPPSCFYLSRKRSLWFP